MKQSNVQRLLSEVKNLKEFERKTGVKYRTLDDLKRGITDVDNMSVSIFTKIAHGLGMTADELYFGELDDDITKAEIIEIYESMPVDGKRAILVAARSAKEIYSEQRENDLESD